MTLGLWMNRKETAEYLRLSVRQLDRLCITRSYAGCRPLYSRDEVNAYLAESRTAPSPKSSRRGPGVVALVLPLRRKRNAEPAAWLTDIRTALRIAA
jgi:hypothetical protein